MSLSEQRFAGDGSHSVGEALAERGDMEGAKGVTGARGWGAGGS
jgi:hypothetical protein